MYINDLRMLFVEYKDYMTYLDEAEDRIYERNEKELTEAFKKNPKAIYHFVQGTSIIFDGERKRAFFDFNKKVKAKMDEIAKKFNATVIYYRKGERIDTGIYIRITGVTVIIPLTKSPTTEEDKPAFIEFNIDDDGSYWVEKPLYTSCYQGACVRYWT